MTPTNTACDQPPAGEGFFVGIGSNLQPEYHVPLILSRILRQFGCLWLSSVVHTQPTGMKTTNPFLNAVCLIPTERSAEQLKAWMVALEIELGRDRTHPDKKVLDRSADLDLLLPLKAVDQIEQWPAESYIRPMFLQLLGALRLGDQPTVQAPENCARLILPGLGTPIGEFPVCLAGNQGGVIASAI